MACLITVNELHIIEIAGDSRIIAGEGELRHEHAHKEDVGVVGDTTCAKMPVRIPPNHSFDQSLY